MGLFPETCEIVGADDVLAGIDEQLTLPEERFDAWIRWREMSQLREPRIDELLRRRRVTTWRFAEESVRFWRGKGSAGGGVPRRHSRACPPSRATPPGGTLARADAKGLDFAQYLENNDAYNFFKDLGDGLLITGPTGTNVADVAFLLVGKGAALP